MQVIILLLVTCELCSTIRVPVSWDQGDSESEEKENIKNEEQFSVESFKPQDSDASLPQNEKSAPGEYFEYTAKKPQFAVDVAAFHGVQSPNNHYKAYPIKPYTGRVKPQLGKHHIFENSKTLHKPFQDFTKIKEDVGHASPVSSSYEVFHPYEAETPALREIYKDPILSKIRNDLENSKNRLQQYEKNAGEPDITKGEYLENPQKTDDKLFPRRHRPAPFEIHRPQRRPVYYRPVPVYNNREQYLNHKLRQPWNHNIAKIRPMHYRPIKNHIQNLRQNHALKYDDERNEYPQVQFSENYSTDPKDGYDIYEKGRDKFVRLRNNVDESINKAVEANRPTTYQKLEIQNNDSVENSADDDDAEEFVPIKNYAQVRKTETFRHLPRAAAIEEAETYDEIKNAPRLREAVKSTKAQTVYSEEGYEDAAYDHAGEQKHASENEGHGGFLKEHELSGGKYKTPSVSSNYEDGKESIYRDKVIHAEKWKDDNKDTKEEAEQEDYIESEHEHLLEADNHQTEPQNDDTHRYKRENDNKNETLSGLKMQSDLIKDSNSEHDVDKRKANFSVPEFDLSTTYLNEKQLLKIGKLKMVPKKDTLKQKYPYYFKNLHTVSKNSPLRYAENFKFIPRKSKGGTEFYDSRSNFECPDVDDVPDPIPEKLKGDGHPDKTGDSGEDDLSTKGDENFDTTKKQPRLKGLGDKIDCFKAKYFGENPLDSPFFKEDIISNPEPVFLPNIAAYKLKSPYLNKHKEIAAETNSHNVLEKLKDNSTSDLFTLIEKLRSDQNFFQKPLMKSEKELLTLALNSKNNLNTSELASQSNVYSDVIKNIKNNIVNVTPSNQLTNLSDITTTSNQNNNVTYSFFVNKEDITKSPLARKKRSTPFVYEPYKIIRDSQVQDDLKKAASTSKSNPKIRQLQARRVLDNFSNFSPEEAQLVKRNVNTRPYKNIGRKDRVVKHTSSKNDRVEDTEIVDVSVDKRRGEPRYEIKHSNHKSRYTPVIDKKSMTKDDYEAQISNVKKPVTLSSKESSLTGASRQQSRTPKPYFDISKFIPHTKESQNTAASNTRKTISSTTSTHRPQVSSNEYIEQYEDINSDEDYEEYDEEHDDEKTQTTTTTSKPTIRLRIRPTTTTQEPPQYKEDPKLKLVTRFRDYKPEESHHTKQQEKHHTEKPIQTSKIKTNEQTIAPKFREKKKKLTKSTIVTDTRNYGDGEDDMRKVEVDELIGVKHNMDDYVPLYEKDEDNKSKALSDESSDNEDEIDDDESHDSNSDSEEDEDENDDDEEEEDDDNDYDSSAGDDEDENTESETKNTTPEPTKRTLVITTDAPAPTTASRNAKIQEKPIVTRKKIEIHKELPVNKSSPHITQFKQDIKEIEIIKETPNLKHANPLKRKPDKNVEVFDLYKDENLAKDINTLGVEIFKENLDLRMGPKHGGNYRSVETSTVPTRKKLTHSKDDAETSESEYTKHIEVDNDSTNRGIPKRISQKARSEAKNSKLIELSGDSPDTSMHEGNLKYRGTSRNKEEKSQKYIELDDEDDENTNSDSRENKSSSRNGRPMHGGNYRSAKLTTEYKPQTIEATNTRRVKDARRNAALVLNSFVQAAPVLTTTPGYILDPSKRKYYYVDA